MPQVRREEVHGALVANPDVIVIGGGAIGLSIAWRSRRRGLAVCVVDDARPGRASHASAGMIAPVSEAHFGEDDLLDLNLASAQSYPAFIAELEEAGRIETGYRRCGTVVVARDTDDNAALERLYRWQRELGLEVERLRGRECRAMEPALAPAIRGGILVGGDHQVDNRKLIEALAAACDASGVRRVQGEVAEVTKAGDRVTGIRTQAGDSLTSDWVVLAAGCWSSQLRGLAPEAVPPVRPVKGQLLLLRGPAGPPLIERNVRSLDIYIVARGDGRLVVGASVEELGFDRTPTAGALYELLRDAIEIVPGITEQVVLEIAVGLRPGSPDNAPLLGLGAMDGLAVATGHYRNGILLTPVTGETIAELLATGRVPELIAPFDPRRFASQPVPL